MGALASQETHVAQRTCGACMTTNGGRNASLAQRLGMTYAKAAAPAPTSLLPQPQPQPLRHRLCRFLLHQLRAPHRLQEPPCQLHHHRLPATRRSMHSAEALASQETHVAQRTCGACMTTNGGRNASLAQRL